VTWRRWRAAVALCSVLLASCAGATRPPVLPARPSLPAVNFVQPCDPQAAVGLTAAGIEDIKRRDAAWRAYSERLESLLRGAN
jgi:hypothetical protein